MRFNQLVNQVISESDILLLVVDARRIEDSINRELESKILGSGKKFLYVVNKVDLLAQGEQKKLKLKNSVFISARDRLGTMRLLRKIMQIGHGKEVIVGVLGFPNTGKSTLINALKGRHSTKTSSVSGFTRSLQHIRISDSILLIDCPGVFDYGDKKDTSLALFGAVSADKVRDPENVVCDIIKNLDGRIEAFFGVERKDDPFDTLEAIALKKNIVRKGGVPDTVRMAREILRLCQSGKIAVS